MRFSPDPGFLLIPALALALSMGFLLHSPRAYAHLPPSYFLVKSLSNKRQGVKGVRVKSVVNALVGNQQNGVRFRAITFFDPSSKTLRSYAYDEQGHELYGVERHYGSETNIPFTGALLFDSDADSLARGLVSKGIPIRLEDELLKLPDENARREVERVTLVRMKHVPVWKVAQDAGAKNEIIFEKDTFLPLQFVSEAYGSWVNVRFENYRYFREYPFPRSVSLIEGQGENEKIVLKDELQDLTSINPAVEFKKPMHLGFTDEGNRADGSLRDLIQSYYHSIR